MSIFEASPVSVPGFATALKSGGFAVARVTTQVGAPSLVELDFYDALGVPTRSGVDIASITAGRTLKGEVLVVALNDGRAGVYWTETDPVGRFDAIMFRGVTSSGTLGSLRTIATPNPPVDRYYDNVNAAVLANGDVVMSADRVNNTPGSADTIVIRLQFSPTASGVSAETVSSTTSARDLYSSVAALSGGGYAIVYQTIDRVANLAEPDEPFTKVDTFFKVYAADGSVLTGGLVGTNYGTGYESYFDFSPAPAWVTALGDGGFAIQYSTGELITPTRGFQYVQHAGGFIGVYTAQGGQRGTIDVPSIYEMTLGPTSQGSPQGPIPLATGIVPLADGSFVLLGDIEPYIQTDLTRAILYDRGLSAVTGADPLSNPAGIRQLLVGGERLPDGRILLSGFDDAFGLKTLVFNLRALDLTPSLVPENVPGGTVVGTLTPVGLDPSDIASLTLGGADAALFRLLPDRRIVVADGVKLNFEEDASKAVTVTMTDKGGRVTVTSFDIAVRDMNEPPTDVKLSKLIFSTERDFTVGQVLATFTGVDPDTTDILAFELPGNAGGLVRVSGDKLLVVDAARLNAIIEPTTIDIVAKVVDLGSEEFTKSLRLSFVTDGSPIATPDVFKFDEETPVEPVLIQVLKNDVAVAAEIDMSTLRITRAPSYGAAVVSASGAIRYTPGPDGFKPTSFEYRFDDVEQRQSNLGIVRIVDRDPVPDPFVVNGIAEWLDEPTAGYSEAAGNFTIGRSDGWASLLRVEGGTIRAYVDRLEVTGAVVYAGIGLNAANPQLALPLFRGSFTLNVTGARGAVVDSLSPAPDLDLAGFEVRVDTMQLEPQRIQLSGPFTMSPKLGGATFALTNTITITAGGVSFLSDVLRLPDMEVRFPVTVAWKTKGVALTYAGVDDSMKLQGTLEVSDALWTHVFKNVNPVLWAKDTKGALSAKLDIGEYLNPINTNYLQVKDNALTGRGTFTLPEIRLGGGFVIKDLSATLTATDAFVLIGGGLKFGIPFGPLGGSALDPVLVEASIEIYLEPRIELKSLSFGLSNVQIPIPQVPLLYINKLIGKVDGLADAVPGGAQKAALSIEGTIGLDYGAPHGLAVPAWLGLPDNFSSGRPVNLDITGKIQQAADTKALSIGGSASFFLFNPGIFKATVGSVAGLPLTTGGFLPDLPLVDFGTGAVNASGSFNIGTVFSGSGKLKGDLLVGAPGAATGAGSANAAFMAASGTGTVKFPSLDAFGILKGATLANAEFFAIFSNDGNYRNDSIGVAGELPIGPGKIANSGFQLFGDGEVNVFTGGAGLPKVGSWLVAPATDWIVLHASWANASTNPARLVVTYKAQVGGPVLATYAEDQFAAAGIYLIEALTTERSRSASVLSPLAGVWDIDLVDETGLGPVEYGAFGAVVLPEVVWTSVVRRGGAAPAIDAAIDVRHAAAGTLVDLYADTDRAGFDGVLLASGLSVAQAAAGVSWNLADAPPGDLFLYAVVRDSVSGFTRTPYRETAVRGADVADLALSMARDPGAAEGAPVVDFTVRVVNQGSDSAAGVSLALDVAGATYSVISRSPGVDAPVVEGSTLRFTRPTLAPQEAFEIVVRMVGASGGAALPPASASVGALSIDPDLADNLVLFASGGTELALPVLSIAAVGSGNLNEGQSGVTLFPFTVTRSGDLASPSSARFVVVSAQADETDFAAAAREGIVSFAAGEAQASVSVAVLGDLAFEGPETFQVKLSEAQNARLGTAWAAATILNDDAMPASQLAVQAEPVAHREGRDGLNIFRFTVTRLGDPDAVVVVDWAVTGAGDHPADGADFVGGTMPRGRLTLAAGEVSRALDVWVDGDLVVEPDEGFVLTLSNPSGASLARASASGTLLNDETLLRGTPGPDSLAGGANNDRIEGLDSDDTLSGAAGDDTLDGGAGIDTASYAGLFNDYRWTAAPGSDPLRPLFVEAMNGSDGSDELIGIEFIQFSDRRIDVARLLTPPLPPVLLAVQDDVGPTTGAMPSGTRSDDARPTLSGTALPGASVSVFDGSTLLGSAVADGEGRWTFTAPELAQALHTFTLQQTRDDRAVSARSSAFALIVDLINDAPTGAVSISGRAELNARLSAVSTLADADGLGVLQYQWLRGGRDIAGATQSSWVLVPEDVGTAISVRVSWVDGGGATETVVSAATPAVIGYTVITGTSGADTLAGTASIDSISGGAGNDVLFGDIGGDLLDGGAGLDVASYRASGTAIQADLRAGIVTQGADRDTLIGIEAILASSAGDLLRGADGVDTARGDTLRGAGGSDSIDGGSGVDTAEFSGARAGYTVTRSGDVITVSDTDAGDGLDGIDTLSSVERLIFADKLIAFGTRAEEIARVAFVLWTPDIVGSGMLFSRGLSYYDVGYDFSTMCGAALTFWNQQGAEFAQLLLRGTPGTTRTLADVLAIMNNAGGGEAGRVAALAALARDDATTAQLELKGVFDQGLAADLVVPGFGPLFGLLPMGG